MAIPEQVRRQSEAVQQLYKELNNEPEEQAVVEAEGELQAEESNDVAEQADSVEEQATPSDTEEQGSSDSQDARTLEQKYKTLQGMYNAEVPRLHAERRDLTNRVAQLEQLLASITDQQGSDREAAKANAEVVKLITEKDEEEYGDSIEIMRKAAREETSAYQQEIAELKQMIRQMQASVLPRVEQVAHRQAQSAEQSFWSDLTALVPDWRDVNNTAEFQSWLLETNPLTGTNHQTYLEEAQRSLDARRVAEFFNTWKGLTGKSVAQPNRSSSADQLEKQVAPGRGRSTGVPQNTEKTYTPADIEKFYDDVRSGKYRGRETERSRIERDIFAAQRENRIVTS